MAEKFQATLDFAQSLDEADPLRAFRSEFYMPRMDHGSEVVYLTGNSLGLQPKSTAAYIQQELEDWQKLGVEGHTRARKPWMPYHELVTAQMADVAGAKHDEVVVMNSLTVNLHLLLVSFYRPTESRYKILIESDAFPSDKYTADSQVSFHGYDPNDAVIRLTPRAGEDCLQPDDVLQAIDRHGQEIATILIGGVNYYTGQVFDMKAITEAGHRNGCLVGFDLAHAAGNIPLQLHDWGVDFAAWCSYKYLNSGPGGIAAAFVHNRHARDHSLSRFSGWWGHQKSTRFEMPDEFVPIPGAEGWQLSNPPIFQLAALRASLDVFAKTDMLSLQRKSRLLTGYFEYLMETLAGVSVITPSDTNQRGCQLSLRLDSNARKVFDQLELHGAVCDWREPDVIRAAPVPLYNSFEDVFRFFEILKKLTED